uniref:PX domain-containing protein n=1 Tax=Gopherus agassizii TaxID=38772 RepID=A0A452GMN3_9SAUR
MLGSPFRLQAYNIHVNGVLHCQVRYSQLLGLHEQLRKEYGANVVPAFPPKKIFTLTPAEVEQRREQLEKYMQSVYTCLFVLSAGASMGDGGCTKVDRGVL